MCCKHPSHACLIRLEVLRNPHFSLPSEIILSLEKGKLRDHRKPFISTFPPASLYSSPSEKSHWFREMLLPYISMRNLNWCFLLHVSNFTSFLLQVSIWLG